MPESLVSIHAGFDPRGYPAPTAASLVRHGKPPQEAAFVRDPCLRDFDLSVGGTLTARLAGRQPGAAQPPTARLIRSRFLRSGAQPGGTGAQSPGRGQAIGVPWVPPGESLTSPWRRS